MENYDELIDEAEDSVDNSEDIEDMQYEQYESTYPKQMEKDSMFSWFWKIVGLKEPEKVIRVGNLHNKEVGESTISVRDCMNLSQLGHIFKHDKFANYFEEKAKITSATSMARKGWFMELSISQKRVRERTKSSSGFEGWKKKRIFGKSQETQEE